MTRDRSQDGDDDCLKCGGVGMVSVYLNNVGGSVECDRCDGTGEEP